MTTVSDSLGFMLRRRLGIGALVALAAFASCREPTQITITVTTDAECPGEAAVEPTLLDTFITAGTDLRPEDLVAANVTDQCTAKSGDNEIGTLVLIPGEGDSKAVEVVVIGGVDAHGDATQGLVAALKADDCRALVEAKQGVQGQPCIVARRRLGFIDHTKLALPIKLDKRCIGVECSEDLTCFGGVCVSAEVNCDDQGNCSDPGGEGGAGTGGGGGGDGCNPVTCTDDCDNSAKNGDCGPDGCACSGCSDSGCDDFCGMLGQFVGSCSGDACLCIPGCNANDCSASSACTGPTAGQCNGTTGSCDCVCDASKCDASCASLGQDGACVGGACVCDGTCSGSGDCAGLDCGTLANPTCVGQSCTCVCNETACDTHCVGQGSPTGGSCASGSCACDTPCNPAICGMAPCNGTCTPTGCDCGTCEPTACPSCPNKGEVPYCSDPDTCGCQCQAGECTADCVAMGAAGGNCTPDCVCIGGTTSTTSGSTSSTGGCNVLACNAMCSPAGLTCDTGTCACECILSQCSSHCGGNGTCATPLGPCNCGGSSTSSGFGGGFMGVAGGIQ